jgi:hypothetical protein
MLLFSILHTCAIIYSQFMRNQLVQISKEHHKALLSMQLRESDLLASLHECSVALNQSLDILQRQSPHRSIPDDLLQTALKLRELLYIPRLL